MLDLSLKRNLVAVIPIGIATALGAGIAFFIPERGRLFAAGHGAVVGMILGLLIAVLMRRSSVKPNHTQTRSSYLRAMWWKRWGFCSFLVSGVTVPLSQFVGTNAFLYWLILWFAPSYLIFMYCGWLLSRFRCPNCQTPFREPQSFFVREVGCATCGQIWIESPDNRADDETRSDENITESESKRGDGKP